MNISLWCETVSSGDIPSNYSERVIVNNIAYKKFYTFKSCSETADENLAFIRESGKQVYITFNKLLMPVESLCDREYLIYDFGVKEGETITRFDWITQKSVSSTIVKLIR